MAVSGDSVVCAAAAAILAIAAGRANAAEANAASPGGAPAYLEWNVADGTPCLSVEAFRGDVEHALSGAPFGSKESTRRGLSVAAESGAVSTTRVVMTLRDGDRELGSRTVEFASKDCKKARETVVIVAAMLLEVPEEEEVASDVPEPGDGPAASPPEPDRAPSPVSPEKRSVRPLRLDASVAATVTSGFVPRFGVGGRAEFVLDAKYVPLLLLSAGASVGATVQAPRGHVDFSALELGFGVAPLAAHLGTRFDAFAFASVVVVGVDASASGFGLDHTELLWAPSGAAGAALRFRPFGEPMFASFEGRILVPFTRPRFGVVLADGSELEVHRIGAIGFDVAAGLGWEFR